MAKKIYSNSRRKIAKRKSAKTEKIVVQVYACIIICVMAFALSKAEGDYGKIMRQKIKVALNSDINIENVKSAWSEKAGSIDFKMPEFSFPEEL